MLGWSPGTRGAVDGDVIVLPDLADSAAFAAWLPQARAKFVLTSFAEPTCRPDEKWVELARPATVERLRASRDTARRDWQRRLDRAGRDLNQRLDAAGAAGILTSIWSAGWGVNKIF